jgi:hypothetical protein
MKNTKQTIRRLSQAAMFSTVRGVAAAAGSAVVAVIIWWLQNH